MNKFIKLLIITVMLMLPSAAYAYNVVDLPEEMTLSDAMGIFSADEIKSATISNVSDEQYIDLTREQINDFYYAVYNMSVYRSINPTPFRGTAINLHTDTDVVSYFVGSGIQIGMYGEDNYVCYKVKGADEDFLTYIDSTYKDSEEKRSGATININRSNDFLKLPSAQWAKATITEAAKRNLVPYRLTSKYSANISREEFCVLIGQFLTVTSEYASLDAYVEHKNGAYLRGNFDDCDGKDSSIDVLYTLGIVNGRGDNKFDPDGTLSREEAAKIITSAAEQFITIYTNKNLTYSDQYEISKWAHYSVQWVTDKGIMNGTEANVFSPHSDYTVEQAITTVSRLYEYVKSLIV